MAITKATASSIAPAAKGDLVVGSATNDAAVLAVGSANQVLTVDSSTGTGLKWAAPSSPSFVGCSVTRTNTSTALTNGVNYLVAFTTENYDTDSFHDNSTNNSRITIPSGKGGKYAITLQYNNALGAVGSGAIIRIYLNGSQITQGFREGEVFRSVNSAAEASAVLTLSAGDYIEMGYQQGNTETVNMWFIMSATYLGA